MYTSFNQEALSNLESSTKYTEYLKTLSNGDIRGVGGSFYNDGGGGGGGAQGLNRNQSQRRSRRRIQNQIQGSAPFLPISDNEVKFSNIFSPNESNALKLHLLQKTSSLPLLDHEVDDDNNAREDSNNGVVENYGSVAGDDPRFLHNSRRRSTAIGLPHENLNNAAIPRARKGDPVANILYSTIRHGAAVTNASNNHANNEYDNPSADETLHTGSDSKVDYDPHEPLAAVDQIALRHELLNNIRAISRATYFEDLYTGKVRRNSGSPEEEILRLLENPEAAAALAHSNSTTGERTIPSKDASLSRVDRWVKETSDASSRAAQNNDTDEDREGQHASLYHNSVLEDKQVRGKGKSKANRIGGAGRGHDGVVSDVTTESDVETESAHRIKRTNKTTKYHQQVSKSISTAVTDHDPNSSQKHFSRNTDRTVVTRSMGKPFVPPPPGVIEKTSSYLQAKYLNDSSSNKSYQSKNDRLLIVDPSVGGGDMRRPFSFGVNSSVDDLVPLSVSLPNVAQNSSMSYRSTPLGMHATVRMHGGVGVSRPENLNYSMANLSTATTTTMNHSDKNSVRQKFDRRKMNAISNDTEQVAAAGRRTMAHQKSMAGKEVRRANRVTRPSDRGVPGLYSRLNINQWVMKKVCFYVNGDDLYPRYEYRFRPGKDIRDLDQLLDILTKRFPTLPAGARFIFTMDGYPISGLDELIHDNSYVVSSTRKFKALKYGNGEKGSESLPDIRGKERGTQRKHPTLNRKLSASDGNLHRNKRGAVAAFPKQSQSFAKQKSVNSLNSKSVSDVPKVVAHVIEEASSAAALLNQSPLMAREPIRVINGSRPSLQSQVLLNTRTSQPFEDLVKDLALSVKVPKQPIGNCLKTLAGRHIRSYSQLRSELKAGQRAFFIYSDTKPVVSVSTLKPNSRNVANQNGKPIVKTVLGKVNSNSSSNISDIDSEMKDKRKPQSQRRRRSQSPTASQRTSSRHTNSRSPSPYTNYNNYKN